MRFFHSFQPDLPGGVWKKRGQNLLFITNCMSIKAQQESTDRTVEAISGKSSQQFQDVDTLP